MLFWPGGPRLPVERATQYDEVMLANYQETRIRHFYTLLGEYVR